MQAVGLAPERLSHRGPQGAQALWRLLNDRVGEMLALVAAHQGDTLGLAVLPKIITRSMKLLARRGMWVEVEGSTSIAKNDSDSDEARTLRPLQAAPGPGGQAPGKAQTVHCTVRVRARLLKRVFEIDMPRSPNCGGRLDVIAVTLQAPVIEKILTRLGTAGLPEPWK